MRSPTQLCMVKWDVVMIMHYCQVLTNFCVLVQNTVFKLGYIQVLPKHQINLFSFHMFQSPNNHFDDEEKLTLIQSNFVFHIFFEKHISCIKYNNKGHI